MPLTRTVTAPASAKIYDWGRLNITLFLSPVVTPKLLIYKTNKWPADSTEFDYPVDFIELHFIKSRWSHGRVAAQVMALRLLTFLENGSSAFD